MSDRTTCWLLGDQLNPDLDVLDDADDVLLIEAHGFADRKPYHAHKLTLVFSAMRHFRDELRERGHDVTYLRAGSFGEALDEFLAERAAGARDGKGGDGDDGGDEPRLRLMRPASHGAGARLRELVAERGGTLDLVDNELFWTTPADWREWTGGEEAETGDGEPLLGEGGAAERTFRQENWYRRVRRETGVLMDGEEPVGGEWNYDDLNQETPPDDWEPPARPAFEPDELTRETHAWVRERFDTWGTDSLDGFAWPVTRDEAREALGRFVRDGLPAFGRYEDAMVGGEPFLSHSLLSPAINLGLLDPREPVRAVERAYAERGVDPGGYDPEVRGDTGGGTTSLDQFGGDADAAAAGDAPDDRDATDDDLAPVPLNAAEGFVRQVIGWREFMRHVYREAMPELADANQLEQERDLPPAYWDGDTDMRCLSEAVGHVREFGYAHHIERLMVLSNFALVYGADPAELNEWFHLGFVDAYHWVTTPNVVAMGSFGTDVLSSKPYASSGSYVNRMSDHCADCPYAVSRTTGEGACPFNALYWDFLKENEETLRGTGRMGLMYSHVDDKDDAEWESIRERADRVRELAADGEL
ncbi:cryptochrome/photolyase family protein [Halorubrum sp. SD612]|uniref:cryptochrome/photolyase family protein n=1 Tax=Halorubrum sp. SD612 TaxID=1855863 RepID=UPI000A2D0629|nr:cryptochrome/photolyase family protein [Halorubrum sp. SD612]OTF13151.1 cryptochrome/photolyase family protein [Halorubrum sp. SD612]